MASPKPSTKLRARITLSTSLKTYADQPIVYTLSALVLQTNPKK